MGKDVWMYLLLIDNVPHSILNMSDSGWGKFQEKYAEKHNINQSRIKLQYFRVTEVPDFCDYCNEEACFQSTPIGKINETKSYCFQHMNER